MVADRYSRQFPLFVHWTQRGYAVLLVDNRGTAYRDRAFTRAFKLADASAILPLDYARLPFVAVIGFVLFAEVPDVWTWVGAAVIAGAAIYIAQRESRVARERPTLQVSAEAPKNRP